MAEHRPEATYQPQEVGDLEMAFPAEVQHLMPDMADMPDVFEIPDTWVKFQQNWFFDGLPAETTFEPREGIDPNRAIRHLKAIQGSFEPKHEHKEAVVAYLASLWFRRIVTPTAIYGDSE